MRCTIITGLAVLVACAASATAADNGWGVGAAYWDTKDADSAFGASTKFSFELVPGAQLDLRGSYFNDLGKDEGGVDADLKVIPLEVGFALSYPAGRVVDLTAGAGIGYYFMDGSVSSSDDRTVQPANPEDEVGFYAAAGLEWTLRKSGASFGETEAGLYAEVMYRVVSADNIKVESGETIRLSDADLDGVGLNLGIMIKW
jgi:hypothetical protein